MLVLEQGIAGLLRSAELPHMLGDTVNQGARGFQCDLGGELGDVELEYVQSRGLVVMVARLWMDTGEGAPLPRVIHCSEQGELMLVGLKV